MLVSSTCFRGLRLYCRRSVLYPQSSSVRTLFHPFGPPPTDLDIIRNVSAKTSLPHLPREQLEKVKSWNNNNEAWDGIIENKSQSKDGGTTSSQEKPGQTWLGDISTKAFGPYEGRTVNLRHNYTITAAWNVLNSILRVNNVRRELRLTARHEQKGEKRRRLRSQRWRRRFAHEVRMKVKLVMEMRNRDRLWGSKH